MKMLSNVLNFKLKQRKFLTMKKTFQNRLDAIDWIAGYVENEGQFESLREELNFNFIYSGTYFLEIEVQLPEIVMLDKQGGA